MTIASSSGLSDKDIERMVSEAEQYAETDKERKQLIEEANKSDSVCADTEKAMNEFKDQLDATEKENRLIGDLRASPPRCGPVMHQSLRTPYPRRSTRRSRRAWVSSRRYTRKGTPRSRPRRRPLRRRTTERVL